MRHWLVATYKANELKKLEINLLNQKFDYYLPKIITRKVNCNPKEEALFPGYIFINTSFKNYSALKYTRGIKKILKFGGNVPSISDQDIKKMQMAEKISKSDPIIPQIKIGQKAIIKEGFLKGSIVKISSLPSKDRISILLTFLGSLRRVTIPEKNLIF